MSQKIEFKFKIGERVKIREGQRRGTVKEQWYDGNEKKYLVRYADRNGAIFSSWFTSEEVMR